MITTMRRIPSSVVIILPLIYPDSINFKLRLLLSVTGKRTLLAVLRNQIHTLASVHLVGTNEDRVSISDKDSMLATNV